MDNLENKLLKIQYFKNIHNISMNYEFENNLNRIMGIRKWKLTAFDINNNEICNVFDCEKNNCIKYIKFINKINNKNFKITNDLIIKIKNDKRKFIDENIENKLFNTQKKKYFLEYCKEAGFNINDIHNIKNKSNNFKILFGLRLGIDLESLNSKLELF